MDALLSPKKTPKLRVGDVMIPLTIQLQRHRSRHVSGIPNNLCRGSDDVPRQGFSFDLNLHGPEREKEDRADTAHTKARFGRGNRDSRRGCAGAGRGRGRDRPNPA
jgi:hypothetical protein